MDSLCPDLICVILEYVDERDVCSFMSTCKRMRVSDSYLQKVAFDSPRNNILHFIRDTANHHATICSLRISNFSNIEYGGNIGDWFSFPETIIMDNCNVYEIGGNIHTNTKTLHINCSRSRTIKLDWCKFPKLSAIYINGADSTMRIRMNRCGNSSVSIAHV